MKRIATVGGLGHIPKIPGTVGSAVGLAISWGFSGNFFLQALVCGAVVVLALWSAGPAARKMGQEDPSCIVIDEVAGMMVALLGLPARWPVYLAGFVLFRLLDVFKPLGLRRLERLPGSLGIVLDDLAAGLIVWLLLRLILHL